MFVIDSPLRIYVFPEPFVTLLDGHPIMNIAQKDDSEVPYRKFMFEHFDISYKWKQAHSELFDQMTKISLKSLFIILANVKQSENSNLFEF